MLVPSRGPAAWWAVGLLVLQSVKSITERMARERSRRRRIPLSRVSQAWLAAYRRDAPKHEAEP